MQSNKGVIEAFKNRLEKTELMLLLEGNGRDIDGACGQLRKKFLER